MTMLALPGLGSDGERLGYDDAFNQFHRKFTRNLKRQTRGMGVMVRVSATRVVGEPDARDIKVIVPNTPALDESWFTSCFESCHGLRGKYFLGFWDIRLTTSKKPHAATRPCRQQDKSVVTLSFRRASEPR